VRGDIGVRSLQDHHDRLRRGAGVPPAPGSPSEEGG
jgi:hypothetical protein